jgi:hypothetical protein
VVLLLARAMKVDIDMSELRSDHAAALAALAPASVLAAVRGPAVAAAMAERATHSYQNRTGRLEASTEAVTLSRTPALVDVELHAGPFVADVPRPYAVFVDARGLMRIRILAERADVQIQARLARLIA